jgi:hypothetical protein
MVVCYLRGVGGQLGVGKLAEWIRLQRHLPRRTMVDLSFTMSVRDATNDYVRDLERIGKKLSTSP